MDVCSHGRPDHQELIRRLLDALGLGTHARPKTPEAVFEECLAEARELRSDANERAAERVALLPATNRTRCRRCLRSPLGPCEVCEAIDARAAVLRAGT